MIQGRRIAFRYANAGDVGILKKAAEDCKEWLFWDGGQLSMDSFPAALQQDGGKTWVAELPGEPVGFITLADQNITQRSVELRYVALTKESSNPWLYMDLLNTVGILCFTVLGLHRAHGKVYGSQFNLRIELPDIVSAAVEFSTSASNVPLSKFTRETPAIFCDAAPVRINRIFPK